MALNINQFAQSVVKGALSLQLEPNTIAAQVYASEAVALVPGQAVKIVDQLNGVPVVTAATADTDDIYGFVNYNQKNATFAALAPVEISFFRGNVMWMEAASAIAANAQVGIVVSGQLVQTAASTDRIIGRAIDKAAATGDLIRVVIDLPGATA